VDRFVNPKKAAIITGGATGVGAATSLELAARGYAILINYHRRKAEASRVAAQCLELGVDAVCVQGDVSVDDDCRRVAAVAGERWGGAGALVNCAAITRFVPADALDAVSGDDFRLVYETNVVGPFQMIRAAAPLMKPCGGAIVNISSIASLTGSGSSYPYVASKAALNAITIGLARALAPMIRVNALLPGFIEGNWLRDGVGETAYERLKAEFCAASALGIVCGPRHIAESAVWLIDGAQAVTGQLIVVDAGVLLGKPPMSKP
jgi:3-oxoacyl-[acyl-carrier protein] reductase